MSESVDALKEELNSAVDTLKNDKTIEELGKEMQDIKKLITDGKETQQTLQRLEEIYKQSSAYLKSQAEQHEENNDVEHSGHDLNVESENEDEKKEGLYF